MYDKTVISYIVLVDIFVFVRKRSKHNKSVLFHYCSKGDRCPSATARSTVGGTQGHLDLERDPLIHVIEERNKENPKLQRSQPIITEYGELYFSLNKWARCLQMMVSAFSIPTDMENTSGLILVTL